MNANVTWMFFENRFANLDVHFLDHGVHTPLGSEIMIEAKIIKWSRTDLVDKVTESRGSFMLRKWNYTYGQIGVHHTVAFYMVHWKGRTLKYGRLNESVVPSSEWTVGVG